MKLGVVRLVSLVACLWIVIVAPQVKAQGLSPIRQTFHKKARGVVQATNASDMPKIISCRPQGFDVNEHGSMQFGELNPDLHVRISDERAEVAPNGTRMVSFEATPHGAPGWFAITCRFEPTHHRQGLTLALEMTSVVLIENDKILPADVAIRAHREDDGRRVIVEVRNNSNELAQIGPGEITGGRKKEQITALTLFPHHVRLIEMDWKDADLAQNVRIQVGKKWLQTHIQ